MSISGIIVRNRFGQNAFHKNEKIVEQIKTPLNQYNLSPSRINLNSNYNEGKSLNILNFQKQIDLRNNQLNENDILNTNPYDLNQKGNKFASLINNNLMGKYHDKKSIQFDSIPYESSNWQKLIRGNKKLIVNPNNLQFNKLLKNHSQVVPNYYILPLSDNLKNVTKGFDFENNSDNNKQSKLNKRKSTNNFKEKCLFDKIDKIDKIDKNKIINPLNTGLLDLDALNLSERVLSFKNPCYFKSFDSNIHLNEYNIINERFEDLRKNDYNYCKKFNIDSKLMQYDPYAKQKEIEKFRKGQSQKRIYNNSQYLERKSQNLINLRNLMYPDKVNQSLNKIKNERKYIDENKPNNNHLKNLNNFKNFKNSKKLNYFNIGKRLKSKPAFINKSILEKISDLKDKSDKYLKESMDQSLNENNSNLSFINSSIGNQTVLTNNKLLHPYNLDPSQPSYNKIKINGTNNLLTKDHNKGFICQNCGFANKFNIEKQYCSLRKYIDKPDSIKITSNPYLDLEKENICKRNLNRNAKRPFKSNRWSNDDLINLGWIQEVINSSNF